MGGRRLRRSSGSSPREMSHTLAVLCVAALTSSHPEKATSVAVMRPVWLPVSRLRTGSYDWAQEED